MSFAAASAGAVTLTVTPDNLTLQKADPPNSVSATATATLDSRQSCEGDFPISDYTYEQFWNWSTDNGNLWNPSSGETVADRNTSNFSYTDAGELQHCSQLPSTIKVKATCKIYGGVDDSGEPIVIDADAPLQGPGVSEDQDTVTVTYLNPLTIPGNTQVLSGSPGATVTFSTAFSGGKAPISPESPTPLGGAVTISGSQLTYSYRIPSGAPEGALEDIVKVNGQPTSCGGNSAQIAVTINVLAGPSIAPDPLMLSGSPGATVSGDLAVSGGTADYRWQANNGGSVDPTAGSSVTYSYRIPEDATAGTRSDTVTVTDANGATDEATVTINVLPGPTIEPDPLTLSGSPGATVSGDLAVSGGTADYRWQANNGGSVDPTTGSSVTYSYRIPEDATAGTRSDRVTVIDANGATDEATVTINVTEGPTIEPDPLTLSGSPGATVSGDLAVSGGTADYRWQANNGGSVDPTTGSSVTYSYRIPEDATAGTRSDRVTVIDANGATYTSRVSITVTEIPPTPDLSVNPNALKLTGAAGTEVSSDELQVTGGSGSFALSAEKGTVERKGNAVLYTYRIPPGSSGTITDRVTVSDSDPDVAPVTVPVTIEVLPPIAVTPSPLELSALSLVGVEGEASEPFAVSGGTPPYYLSVASGGSGTVEPARLDAPGSATYAVAIPASSAAVVISDLIVITDSSGNSVEAPVTVQVAASDSLSSRTDLTPNQRNVASAIETVCPQLGKMSSRTAEQEDLFQQCSEMLENSSSSGIPNTLTEITTEKASASTSVGVETGTQQFANIGSRLAALRGGATGVSLSGLSFSVDGQALSAGQVADATITQMSGGAASADNSFGRWGFFLNGSFNFGDKDTTQNESGFDFSTAGVTAGADYRFTDQLIAGGALGYAKADTTFDSDGGGLDTETWHIAGYGTYHWSDRGYVDAIVEYGWQSYDSTRNIRYQVASTTGAISRQAQADYDGTQFGVSIGTGYDFDEGPISYGFYGRAGYLQVDVDGFTEKGAGGLNLNLNDFSSTSVTTTLGARLSRVFNTSYAVLVPQARVEWEHEYDQDADMLVASFAADPIASAFGIDTDSPDRDYFRVGLGISAVFRYGLSAFINYDALLDKSDWTDNLIDVGVRWEFE
ncbi:autotransporter family protein [Thiocapsa bogorovii]|uniref:autotransporter family protein n=1 Tax=Thiocapsa bogorovii TaxID=521689 RepID=UPI001E5DF6C2|nr:autotransporter outer membrane beta-barrel domain-containing protein [Thiocapsa bogorovii]UHD16090.1 autotransporter domain-containing protein [Thiocapsa bogorovii]